jgi:hypothetical protein
MASYKISVFGYEIDATCHELNDEQAEILLKEQGDNQDLSHLGYDIETKLKDFYLFQDNAWSVNRPLINEGLHFTLSREDAEVIKQFSLNEIPNQVEIDTNAKQRKLLILPGKSKKNYLLYYEINKGELFECSFESAEPPRLEDISYSTGKIQHPDGNLIFLDQLFLQGKELTCSYDNNEVSGKSSFMKVWRP